MSLVPPVLLMIALTMCVWITLYATRLPFMLKNKIDPQKWARGEAVVQDTPEKLQDISNNFKNLFEIPVLFYALAILMITTIGFTSFDVIMAYIFVTGRAAHSFIQCTYNKVMHRFAAYFTSCLALILMIISAFVRFIL